MNKVVKFENLFPIGFIFISTINTNPSIWFGGTWEYIGQGKTLVGVDASQTEFNQVKKTGGEKTHTLTTSEMPSHGHELYVDSTLIYYQNGSGTNGIGMSGSYKANCGSSTRAGSAGGGQSHNNLQPYICVYMWERTT